MIGVAGGTATDGGATDDGGAAINGIAREVAAELAALRRMLEPLHEACDGTLLDPGATAEWSMAAAGIFGPTGVLGFVAGALDLDWSEVDQAGWTG